jgi:hypothetical protein
MSELKYTKFISDIDDKLSKSGLPKFGTPEFNSMCFDFFGGKSNKTLTKL